VPEQAAAAPVTPGIVLSPVNGLPGTTVTVSGAGFGAFEAVDIYLGITEAALASASGAGNFAGITVQVPESTGPGRALLTAVGRHSGLSAQAPFTVSDTVTVTNPGNRVSFINTPVNVQIQASDTASGQILTFTATLPPGLSIDPHSGLISGVPTVRGDFPSLVKAQDPTGASGSAAFVWVIGEIG
jgi:hypothetical protein